MDDLDLLDFVYLALKDGDVIDRKSLIEIACQYGRSKKITTQDVERIIDKKIIELIR